MSNNKGIHFKDLEEVRLWAEKEQKTLLIHQGRILDVTSFSHHHPGGGLFLRNLHLQDVQKQLDFHHPLSVTMADTMTIGSFQQEIHKLITTDQCLGIQIWRADHQTYMKLVNSPHWLFVESPRLFDSDFMEALSHNKWYIVPILPCLMIMYFYWQAWGVIPPLGLLLFVGIAGVLSFTLTEYLVHRFIFHSEDMLPDSRLIRYLHFFTHGVHHMLPNDPDRLVLPAPLFALIYFVVVEMGLNKLVNFENPMLDATFRTGFLVGYMIYDISHYAVHHIDTTKHQGSWFHWLQKYHNKHHFSGQNAGFGVSSPLWDIIFRTGYSQSPKLKAK